MTIWCTKCGKPVDCIETMPPDSLDSRGYLAFCHGAVDAFRVTVAAATKWAEGDLPIEVFRSSSASTDCGP